jgi:hypothetical protein
MLKTRLGIEYGGFNLGLSIHGLTGTNHSIIAADMHISVRQL